MLQCGEGLFHGRVDPAIQPCQIDRSGAERRRARRPGDEGDGRAPICRGQCSDRACRTAANDQNVCLAPLCHDFPPTPPCWRPKYVEPMDSYRACSPESAGRRERNR